MSLNARTIALLLAAASGASLPPTVPPHRVSLDLNSVCTVGDDPPFVVSTADDVLAVAERYCAALRTRCRRVCNCVSWGCAAQIEAVARKRLDHRGWMVRDDVVARYRAVCAAAASDAASFATFKTHLAYTEILEHVSAAMGKRYLDEVARRAPALLRGDVWAAIRRSDALGGGVPQRFAAPRLTADGLAVSAAALTTPTTLRYVAVLAQLIARFGARRVPAAASDLALDAYEICECNYFR